MNEQKINDGGTAFPSDWRDFQPCTGEQVVREQYPGMSLRDWFAGMALQGLLANSFYAEQNHNNANVTAQSASKAAYAHADVMLTIRDKVIE